jgi:hypothetical protein
LLLAFFLFSVRVAAVAAKTNPGDSIFDLLGKIRLSLWAPALPTSLNSYSLGAAAAASFTSLQAFRLRAADPSPSRWPSQFNKRDNNIQS